MAATSVKIVEGEADFPVPSAGKPCKTWYKVYGDLKFGALPLVILHGGPGATHDYVENISQLAYLYGIPVVVYDQLGNGLSTHLPEKMGDTGFWTATARLRSQLPQDVQDTLDKHEAEGTTADEAYQRAKLVFYEHILCRKVPMPEPAKTSFAWIKKDPTVSMTMSGPDEFIIAGSLKTWSIIDELHKINATTLLINGRYDEAQDSAVEPFFQHIPKVKWVQFAESSHCPNLEEPERFMEVVGKFLLRNY
ncbi:proline-specific peptidase [Pisolithus orientalis]|uniref:proline-specific peptidase n=1 Tax=Pisolithus orientalis TaxID=936130 RepID=UPI002224CF0E|nr:proline-specific peptidase [Pisolithus orientalis]KAI6001063.1 proline-specific peptidase [Pisolithus orientalis]